MEKYDVMDDGFASLDRTAALVRLDGDEEIYRTLCQVFLEDLPGQIAVIESALTGRSAREAQMMAHTVKSCARAVGADQLGEIMADLEHDLDRGDLGAAWSLLPTVRVEVRLVTALIRDDDALASPGTPCRA